MNQQKLPFAKLTVVSVAKDNIDELFYTEALYRLCMCTCTVKTGVEWLHPIRCSECHLSLAP